MLSPLSAKGSAEYVQRKFGEQEEEIQSRHRKHYPDCNHFPYLYQLVQRFHVIKFVG